MRVPSFSAGVRFELRRLFSAPRTELAVLAANAVIVVAGWWILPAGLKDWLFDSVPGPFAFAIVLETWLLSDVTSTNLLGHDPGAAQGALGRPGGIRRLLRVKITALALLVGVPCAIIAAVLGVIAGDGTRGTEFVPVLLSLPFGVVAVGSMFGVVLPYRSQSLRTRWAYRRPWPTTVRWIIAVAAPYCLGGLVVAALVVPPMSVGAALTGGLRRGPPPPLAMAVAVPLVCLFCGVAFTSGTRAADRIAAALRGQVTRHLADHPVVATRHVS